MKNNKYLSPLCLILSASLSSVSFNAVADTKPAQEPENTLRSPYKIVEDAAMSSWRDVQAENLLRIELDTGVAWVELAPQFAPKHVTNTKALASEGFYDGLSVYRFVEGFVAQGGDATEKKPIKNAKKTLTSERFTKAKLNFSELGFNDNFAHKSGFVDGFAAAQNTQGESWMVHCPGAFAMARNNPVDSGGTEFYVVLGHAPRYLDRNVTVFGRVISGMAAFQSLQREKDDNKPSYNPIHSFKVATELSPEEQKNWQVMKTDSADFRELIRSRANRPEEWFVEQPGYVDVCGVSVPTREAPAKG